MCKVNRPRGAGQPPRPGSEVAPQVWGRPGVGGQQGQPRAAGRWPWAGWLHLGDGAGRTGLIAWKGRGAACSCSPLSQRACVSPAPRPRAGRGSCWPVEGLFAGGRRGPRYQVPDRQPRPCDGELTASQGVLEGAEPPGPLSSWRKPFPARAQSPRPGLGPGLEVLLPGPCQEE